MNQINVDSKSITELESLCFQQMEARELATKNVNGLLEIIAKKRQEATTPQVVEPKKEE